MKHQDFKKLIAAGLTSGLLLATANCGAADVQSYTTPSVQSDAQFSAQLNDEAKKTYESMNADGKKLAQQLANQSCKGKNECKGLNTCKSEANACAGLGSCKGTAKGPFPDKNKAVQVASMKMAEKRKDATK